MPGLAASGEHNGADHGDRRTHQQAQARAEAVERHPDRNLDRRKDEEE